jgi:hypothetical protein
MTSYAQKLTQAHYTDWIHDQFNKAVRRAEANWMVDAWVDTEFDARGEPDDCLTFKVDDRIAFEFDILNGLYIIPPDEVLARVEQHLESTIPPARTAVVINARLEKGINWDSEFAVMFRDFEREYCPKGIIRIDSPDETTLLDKALCSCVSLENSYLPADAIVYRL